MSLILESQRKMNHQTMMPRVNKFLQQSAIHQDDLCEQQLRKQMRIDRYGFKNCELNKFDINPTPVFVKLVDYYPHELCY